MRTIKLVGIGIALAVFVAFMLFNWSDVMIYVGPWSVFIKKPVLVLLSFLAGFLPPYLMHIASRTAWRRKLARLERDAALAAPAVPPAISVPAP